MASSAMNPSTPSAGCPQPKSNCKTCMVQSFWKTGPWSAEAMCAWHGWLTSMENWRSQWLGSLGNSQCVYIYIYIYCIFFCVRWCNQIQSTNLIIAHCWQYLLYLCFSHVDLGKLNGTMGIGQNWSLRETQIWSFVNCGYCWCLIFVQ